MTTTLAVVDTNVAASGLLSRDPASPTRRILDAMLAGRFRYLISVDLLAEYRSVLLRPRLQRLHGLSPERIDKVLARVARNAMVRRPSGAPERAPHGDAHLWGLLSVNPGAVLVTGDRLLQEKPPSFASVTTPADFSAGL